MQQLFSQYLTEICQIYDIGAPLETRSITGGRVHQLWYLRTTKGEYAIKAIQNDNLALQSDTLSPSAAQQIAAFMHQKGIPTVVALKQNGFYTCSIANKEFVVMSWITGSVLLDEKISLQMTDLIGKQLAQIQQVGFEQQFSLPNWVGQPKKVWENLLLSCKNHIEFEKIYAELNNLSRWSQRAESVKNELAREVILSHRDLDPSNVIWLQTKTFCILDWEYAGLIHPQLDLFIVALNWSGVLTGNIHLEKFNSVVAGYYQHKTEIKPFTNTIVAGYFGYCLAWLEYNLKKLATDSAAIKEISQTLAAIQAVENLDLNSVMVAKQ